MTKATPATLRAEIVGRLCLQCGRRCPPEDWRRVNRHSGETEFDGGHARYCRACRRRSGDR